ncbi:MAG: serine/threonine protein kinase [Gemmataceae bacterium]
MAGATARTPLPEKIGPYVILEKIADGGMGTVFKARHAQTGEIVAIKTIPPHLAANPVLLKRFEQEFRAASRLQHPNIVRAIAFGYEDKTPYLVMEYVDGESLGQKIHREGRLSEAVAIRIIAQVAQGLHRAHKAGLIHRDVKPDNILLTSQGEAKLADLGLAKEQDNDLNLTRTGRGLGTPHFMAPEQFRDAKGADVRCDIYSLGATLYMMVTGELPFKSCGPLDAWMKKVHNELTPPRLLAPSLSERTDWAIRRAMAADPQLRPGSCKEFIEDLTGKTLRKPIHQPTDSTPPQDVWYLTYTDDQGKPHVVKGSTAAVRRSLREGLLGDASNIRAARSKSGPFEPLRDFAEFRDLVISLDRLTAAVVGDCRSASSAASDASAAQSAPDGPARKPTRQPPPTITLPTDTRPPVGEEPIEWWTWALVAAVALTTALIAFLVLSQL